MILKLADNAYHITCTQIGNCNSKSPTLDVALSNVINIVTVVVGSLSVIFIIYAGMQFVLSNGNPKTVQSARATLMYSIIGLILAISAYAIVSFVAKSVK